MVGAAVGAAVGPAVSLFLRKLCIITDLEKHRDSIVLIKAHAPVAEGLAYRDGDETRGGSIDRHMVTPPFFPGGKDFPEWIRVGLLP